MSDIQGSPEWIAARIGRVGASRVYDVIARLKGNGWTAARAVYMTELIAERLTGLATEHYVNGAMQWGTDHEAEARAAYEFYCDAAVTSAGFILHPTIPDAGASPDGLIGDDGLVEFKCPRTITHVGTLLGEPIAAQYLAQMQWQMACTGRAWCDFVSYDPRLPEEMRLFVKRVPRDDAAISGMERDVRDFLAEIERKIEALRGRHRPPSDPPVVAHTEMMKAAAAPLPDPLDIPPELDRRVSRRTKPNGTAPDWGGMVVAG